MAADVCTILPTCTVTTGADGSYSIPDLPAGTYTLTQTQPANYADGIDAAGHDRRRCSRHGRRRGHECDRQHRRAGWRHRHNYNFGELSAGLAGRVCVDVDNDGCDAGEPPIAGVSVTMTASPSMARGHAHDDDHGRWQLRFQQLPTPNGRAIPSPRLSLRAMPALDATPRWAARAARSLTTHQRDSAARRHERDGLTTSANCARTCHSPSR